MNIKSCYKVRTIAGQNIVIDYGKLNVSMTKVMALNNTSLYLWNKLSGSEFELEDVIDALLSEYDVERAIAEEDALKWVSLMKDAGLIL